MDDMNKTNSGKLDDDMLEDVSGGKTLVDNRLFGKINEEDKLMKAPGVQINQVSDPSGKLMQA